MARTQTYIKTIGGNMNNKCCSLYSSCHQQVAQLIMDALLALQPQSHRAQLGSAASQWTQVDTGVGLNTAFETEGGQSEDRGYSTEAIYNSTNQDLDLGNDSADGDARFRHQQRVITVCRASNVFTSYSVN